MPDKPDKPKKPASKRAQTPGFTDHWMAAQHLLGGFVRMHINDYTLADDIIQEVARQASANFDQYDPTRPFIA